MGIIYLAGPKAKGACMIKIKEQTSLSAARLSETSSYARLATCRLGGALGSESSPLSVLLACDPRDIPLHTTLPRCILHWHVRRPIWAKGQSQKQHTCAKRGPLPLVVTVWLQHLFIHYHHMDLVEALSTPRLCKSR